MVANARIEEIQDPVAKIMVGNYISLYEAQTAMKEVAERQARDARTQVIRVVTALCPIVLERIRRKDPRAVDKMTLKQLADLAIDEIRHVLDQTYFAADVDFVVLHRKAEEEVERLKQELARRDTQEADLDELEQVKEDLAAARAEADQQRAARHKAEKALEETKAALVAVEAEYETAKEMYRDVQSYQVNPPSTRTSTPATAKAQSPIVPKGPEQEWIQDWRKRRGFENESRIILTLGGTSECRRNHLGDQIVDQHEDVKSKKSGGIWRAFSRLEERGWISVTKTDLRVSGSSASLVKLKQKGRDAYLALTGRPSQRSSLDELLARHKSPEHVYLNLETFDLLRDAGYRVELFPKPRQVSTGNFVPDLQAISPEGNTLWIEVECGGSPKNTEERNHKFEIYYEASEGHFVIATDNKDSMRQIQSEIIFWIDNRPLTLWMTDISALLSGDRSETDGSIWFVKREVGGG